jgi:hypothetical protein
MLDWLMGGKRKEIPEYSLLRAIPSRPLPGKLAEDESGDAFKARCDEIEEELKRPHRRPPDDEPLFTTLINSTGGGILTITVSERPVLPVFSTPFRAADYRQALGGSGRSLKHLLSSPQQLLGMFRDIEAMPIESFCLDRCPRCNIFSAYGTRSTKSVSDLIMVWSVHKSTERGRADLYFQYALDAARTGRLEISRDVALETVGHVTPEDPRPHLLLGQIAVRLKDRQLLREARAFLRFFHFGPWEQRLDDAVRSGSTSFETVG